MCDFVRVKLVGSPLGGRFYRFKHLCIRLLCVDNGVPLRNEPVHLLRGDGLRMRHQEHWHRWQMLLVGWLLIGVRVANKAHTLVELDSPLLNICFGQLHFEPEGAICLCQQLQQGFATDACSTQGVANGKMLAETKFRKLPTGDNACHSNMRMAHGKALKVRVLHCADMLLQCSLFRFGESTLVYLPRLPKKGRICLPERYELNFHLLFILVEAKIVLFYQLVFTSKALLQKEVRRERGLKPYACRSIVGSSTNILYICRLYLK